MLYVARPATLPPIMPRRCTLAQIIRMHADVFAARRVQGPNGSDDNGADGGSGESRDSGRDSGGIADQAERQAAMITQRTLDVLFSSSSEVEPEVLKQVRCAPLVRGACQ